MAVGAFSNELRNLGPGRVRDLHARGVVKSLYVHLAPVDEPTERNLAVLDEYRFLGDDLWAWTVGSGDWRRDAADVRGIVEGLGIRRFMLNFEKAWEGKPLGPFFQSLDDLELDFIMSLAGTGPSFINYDYRECDRRGIPVSWQCYDDSGEGQPAAAVVREAYLTPFVIPGWEYRHHIRPVGAPKSQARYGWGKAHTPSASTCKFNSYIRAGADDAEFRVGPREWGKAVEDHTLRRGGKEVGLLMGRIAYPRIRCTLDVTRGFDQKHTAVGWEARAASCRVPGMPKRPVDVYMLENCPNSVVEAIARGAA